MDKIIKDLASEISKLCASKSCSQCSLYLDNQCCIFTQCSVYILDEFINKPIKSKSIENLVYMLCLACRITKCRECFFYNTRFYDSTKHCCCALNMVTPSRWNEYIIAKLTDEIEKDKFRLALESINSTENPFNKFPKFINKNIALNGFKQFCYN